MAPLFQSHNQRLDGILLARRLRESASTKMDTEEYQESNTVRLDWTIRGLKQLFESSKGEAKSKVTKSVKFGGGRWQILFYPNSGTEGGQYISLYLSCEPTVDERENAVNGKWVRDGLYKFSFELRNLPRTVLFNQKEANDHSFSWKTANWGWAQFARRESVYYQPNTVRNHDAFLITCVISSSPAAPSVPSSIPHRSVPKDLLDVVGSLLDDVTYSDVVFVLPKRLPGRRGSRKIYAARSILKRAEYFESMFGSGFAESSSQSLELTSSQSEFIPVSDGNYDAASRSSHQLEDSDEEDEEELTDVDVENEEDENPPDCNETAEHYPKEKIQVEGNVEPLQSHTPKHTELSSASTGHLGDEIIFSNTQDTNVSTSERNVRAKLSHPSSPRQADDTMEIDRAIAEELKRTAKLGQESVKGPRKVRVVVKDVAYTTYRAVLYYLYTDSIVFAPLASSFLTPLSPVGPSASSQTLPLRSQGEGQNLNPPAGSSSLRTLVQNEHNNFGPSTRKAWIKDWERQNPGRVKPCSAKAVYRVADKLGLSELKTRAFQHIVKSLTISNVPYEMFSTFSAMFEDIRKTQVSFFLDNWNEIRSSDSMKAVWQQIRVGRHPGFEEVWPLIAVNLEFKPHTSDATIGDNREVGSES
ncbi:hypothetical protein DFH11DRAFT_1593744 [Phellopilus nigrolimitatus]|nr:hypothetical protein DFH11DRAFT_1593744 [Phellopilus nigrolimitatus]